MKLKHDMKKERKKNKYVQYNSYKTTGQTMQDYVVDAVVAVTVMYVFLLHVCMLRDC